MTPGGSLHDQGRRLASAPTTRSSSGRRRRQHRAALLGRLDRAARSSRRAANGCEDAAAVHPPDRDRRTRPRRADPEVERAAGVLAEISLIEGSWAKRVYFTELFKTAALDARPPSSRRSARPAREIDSDFELASLLIGAPTSSRPTTRRGRRTSRPARTIESDFEMRARLSSALKRGPVSPASRGGFSTPAVSIESDFEEASLLMQVAKHAAARRARRAGAFFKALCDGRQRLRAPPRAETVAGASDLSPEIAGRDAGIVGARSSRTSRRPRSCWSSSRTQSIEGRCARRSSGALTLIGSAFERGRVLQAVVGAAMPRRRPCWHHPRGAADERRLRGVAGAAGRRRPITSSRAPAATPTSTPPRSSATSNRGGCCRRW